MLPFEKRADEVGVHHVHPLSEAAPIAKLLIVGGDFLVTGGRHAIINLIFVDFTANRIRRQSIKMTEQSQQIPCRIIAKAFQSPDAFI